MSDIVERLRDREQPDLRVWVIRGRDAAYEIERLRAELNQAPDEVLAHDNSQLRGEIERLRADFNDCNTERARWRAEAERLRALGNLDPSEMQAEIDRLRTDNETLKEWCRKLIEAGIEAGDFSASEELPG